MPRTTPAEPSPVEEPRPSGTPAEPAEEELSRGAANQAALAVNPELVAGSFGEYVHAWLVRFRSGETGALPVVGGLVVICLLFQALNSNFLTAGNLVNLLIQGAVFMLLAMGEVFVLLLGEIDLSIGYVAGVGGVLMAELVKESTGWPWWVAMAVSLAGCATIGLLQGTIITRIGLPSFVVTLAGQLIWLAVMLLLLGSGGALPINDSVINNVASGNLSPLLGWVVMLAAASAYGAWTWTRDARRRRSGLVAPPASLTVVKIVAVFAAAVLVVLICNTDRGNVFPIRGVPWALLVVMAVLSVATLILNRTRLGRYIYAVGGNAEAARRGGVALSRIRTTAFTIASFTAGIAGIVYASRLRSVSTAFDGGTMVLYAVAAAVIGGTSLFGGRGRAFHAVLGGLVIAAIDNGMGLQGYSAPAKYAVTGFVLLAAVTIDALARRGRSPS